MSTHDNREGRERQKKRKLNEAKRVELDYLNCFKRTPHAGWVQSTEDGRGKASCFCEESGASE